MGVSEEKIREVADKIVKEYQPEKIILFGSYAWGEPDENSDVDLFVVKESDKGKLDRERELRRKLFNYDFPPMDLLVYTPEELKKRLGIKDIFVSIIINNGKVLYER